MWLIRLMVAVALYGVVQAETGAVSDLGQNRGTLAGVVRSESGAALPEVNVELSGPKTMVVASDFEGWYRFDGLSAGRYTIRFTHVGHEAVTRQDVVVVNGKATSLDVTLQLAVLVGKTVVVSASRHAENIIDAPVSISKVDREEILGDVMNGSVVSALKGVKGIDYTQVGLFRENLSARGFGGIRTTGVLVVEDGYSRPAEGPVTLSVPLSREDMRDIEVIVGPSSALYGQNAARGVVSIRSLDPRKTQGTAVALSGGTRSILKGRFRHSGSQNRVGYKITADHQQGNDFETIRTYYNADSTVSVTDGADFDTRTTRASGGLYYYPDATSRIGLQGGWSSIDIVQFQGRGRFQHNGRGRLRIQADYESPRFLARATFHRMRTGNSQNLNVRALNLIRGSSLEEAIAAATVKTRFDDLGAEARYSGGFLSWDYKVGVDFRHNRIALGGSPIREDQLGVYGLLESDLGKRFRASLSVREDFLDGYDAQFSPRAALIYKPDPTTALRLAYSRAFITSEVTIRQINFELAPGTWVRGGGEGFRFGTADGSPLPAAYAEDIPKLKASKNVSFEAGLKRVLSEKAFLDVSLYRSEASDFVVMAPQRVNDPDQGVFILDESGATRVGETTIGFFNFGRRTILGSDIGLDWYLDHTLSLHANASYIRALELEDSRNQVQPFNTPSVIANLRVNKRGLVRPGTSLGVSLRYVHGFDMDVGTARDRIPTYAVIDANLGLKTSYRVTYRVTAKNLLDHKHIESVGGAELRRIVVGEVEYAF